MKPRSHAASAAGKSTPAPGPASPARVVDRWSATSLPTPRPQSSLPCLAGLRTRGRAVPTPLRAEVLRSSFFPPRRVSGLRRSSQVSDASQAWVAAKAALDALPDLGAVQPFPPSSFCSFVSWICFRSGMDHWLIFLLVDLLKTSNLKMSRCERNQILEKRLTVVFNKQS